MAIPYFYDDTWKKVIEDPPKKKGRYLVSHLVDYIEIIDPDNLTKHKDYLWREIPEPPASN
jgi:hypothetical protein